MWRRSGRAGSGRYRRLNPQARLRPRSPGGRFQHCSGSYGPKGIERFEQFAYSLADQVFNDRPREQMLVGCSPEVGVNEVLHNISHRGSSGCAQMISAIDFTMVQLAYFLDKLKKHSCPDRRQGRREAQERDPLPFQRRAHLERLAHADAAVGLKVTTFGTGNPAANGTISAIVA